MAWIRFRSCPAWAILSVAAAVFVARGASADSGAAVLTRPAPKTASPKTGSPKEAANKAKALKLYDEGMAAYAEGRDGDAVDLLWKAWELDRDRTYICNRATILAAAGRHRDAAESYVLCQQALPPSDAKALETTLDRALLKARKHIGTISVSTNVEGAEVIVDGRLVGKSPLVGPVFVEPGDRPVLVRAPGYWESARVVYSEAGSWINLYTELEPVDADDDVSHVATTPTRYVPEAPPPVQKLEPQPAPAPAPSTAPKPPNPTPQSTSTAAPPNSGADPGSKSMLAVGIGLAAGGATLGVGGFVFATRSLNVMTTLREAVKADSHDQHGCTAVDSRSPCKAADNEEQNSGAFLAISATSFVLSGLGVALIGTQLGGSKPLLGKRTPHVMLGATPTAGFVSVYSRF